MYVQWALAPSGYYIAHAVVSNKHYYASGRTSDQLERNIKNTLYSKERIAFSQVHLEQQKSETLDTKFCSTMFRSKFLKPKPKAETQTVLKHGLIVTPPKPQYEHISEIDHKTGELVVFELREVARFKMRNGTLNLEDVLEDKEIEDA